MTPDGNRGNWMGEDDYHLATDKDRKESSAYVAKVAKLYEKIAYLQTVTMERHERVGDVATVTYADGSVMVIDYAKQNVTLNGEAILALN